MHIGKGRKPRNKAANSPTSSNRSDSTSRPFTLSATRELNHDTGIMAESAPRTLLSTRSSSTPFVEMLAPITPSSTHMDLSNDQATSIIRTARHSLQIGDRAKVSEQMEHIFQKMQQTVVKRVAKAWIKGICPKKQAKFPYHNSKVVPPFWPDINICPFKEPDHIKKGGKFLGLLLSTGMLTLR